MSDTFNYTLTQNDQGSIVVRSTVKSFNLDHVTDKDVVAFYQNFSEVASFDTGLLPLDGTGVLAVRTAGFQTQIVTQHAPGMYYVNWGAHEGDSHARAYYVAQPYRIVIGDFENGNLLGARMFYSPYPITTPSQQLYHVNLPNINCKGYRGNGVGWICLYHKEDWTSLPFNEKVSRFIERCSGVETYNDANMSETDGPRFYSSKSKPSYLSFPDQWQKKSEEEGFNWTLDENLWIPVLVQDMDNQDRHYDNGQPLTLAMAMLGNYQAYYTDTHIPKLYNVISRNDMNLENKHIGDFFKKSFAASPIVYAHRPKDNPYEFTLEQRQKNGSSVFVPSTNNNSDDDEDEESWICDNCEDSFSQSDDQYSVVDSQIVCESCFNECYVFISSAETYFHYDDSSLVYVETANEYFHESYDTIHSCDECSTLYGHSGQSALASLKVKNNFYPLADGNENLCVDCFISFAKEEDLSLTNCYTCQKHVISSTGYSQIYPTVQALIPTSDGSMEPTYITFCNICAPSYLVCPCGLIKNKADNFANCTPTPITSLSTQSELIVNKCCDTCLGPVTFENDEAKASYSSILDKETNDKILNTFYHINVPFITINTTDDDTF